MVVHAEAVETGGRTISSSTPTNPSPAPARIARSCGTTRISLVEGCLIASFAMGAHAGLHLHPRRIHPERERLQGAVDEAYDAKLIGKDNIHGWPFDLYVHHGAGAYICGEETALLEASKARRACRA